MKPVQNGGITNGRACPVLDGGRIHADRRAGCGIARPVEYHFSDDAFRCVPERTVQIEGYTDSTGSDALNQSLSERRAEAVRVALIDRGIDMRRIAARGFGKSNPVANNDTAAGRQQNRRVEVVISSTT